MQNVHEHGCVVARSPACARLAVRYAVRPTAASYTRLARRAHARTYTHLAVWCTSEGWGRVLAGGRTSDGTLVLLAGR